VVHLFEAAPQIEKGAVTISANEHVDDLCKAITNKWENSLLKGRGTELVVRSNLHMKKEERDTKREVVRKKKKKRFKRTCHTFGASLL